MLILMDSYWLQLFAENSEATPGLDGKVCCDQLMMSATGAAKSSGPPRATYLPALGHTEVEERDWFLKA